MSLEDYFVNSCNSDEPDAWDEGFLLKAYEQMISQARLLDDARNVITKNTDNNKPDIPISDSIEREFNEILSRSRNVSMNSVPQGNGSTCSNASKTFNSNQNWNVGDLCQATFSQDGAIYDAHVCKVNYDEGKALIHFIQLDTKEEKALKQLIPSGTVPTSPPDYNSDQQKVVVNNTSIAHHLLSKFLKKGFPPQSACHQSQRPPKSDSLQPNGPSKAFLSRSQGNINTKSQCSPATKPPMKFAFGKPTDVDKNSGDNNNSSNTAASRETKLPPTVNKKQCDSIPSFPPNLEMLAKSLPGMMMKNSLPTTNGSNPLKSMLMSWYMCGYHTGFYEGFKSSQKKS